MGEDIKEIVGMLIILVLIISGVQWFFMRFTHWSVALVVTAFIAVVISFFYVSLSHAAPNGGSNGPDFSEFITPTLVIFASLLCGLILVCYLTKNELPKKAIILPMCIIFVFVIGRYVYQYVDNVSLYSELFSNCEIELLDETAGKSIVNEISFQNISSGLVSNIEINSDEAPFPRLTRNASKIVFQCYTKTNGMSRRIFQFDYSLCKEKDGPAAGLCFWVKQKVVLPMKIIIQPDNKVDLYIDNRLVKQYQLKDENKKKQN